MPACGKSTIGVVLAKTLGKAFLDTDLLIQKREGDLLQNLIDTKGMDSFLRMEEEALLSIEVDNTVIATGGSVVYSDKGMKKLSQLGTIIYIELTLDTIEKRMNNIHSRGIAMGKGETLADLYKKRIPLYEKYAELTINAEGLSVEEAIDEIISKIA